MAESLTLDQLSAAEASLELCQLMFRDLPPGAGTLATPCPKFDLDGLVEHLTGSIVSLGTAAGATVTVSPGAPPEQIIADAAQPALEAWRRRGLEGMVSIPHADLPAEVAAGILTTELLVHAWDFAQATGRTLPSDTALYDYALGLARGIVDPAMRDGDFFADEVPTGDRADALTQLVGFMGRAA